MCYETELNQITSSMSLYSLYANVFLGGDMTQYLLPPTIGKYTLGSLDLVSEKEKVWIENFRNSIRFYI